MPPQFPLVEYDLAGGKSKVAIDLREVRSITIDATGQAIIYIADATLAWIVNAAYDDVLRDWARAKGVGP